MLLAERRSSPAAAARGPSDLEKPTSRRGQVQRLDTVHGLVGMGEACPKCGKGIMRAEPQVPTRCGLRPHPTQGDHDRCASTTDSTDSTQGLTCTQGPCTCASLMPPAPSSSTSTSLAARTLSSAPSLLSAPTSL